MTDARQRAFERAVKSISVRERTESEVKDFLTRRGYERDVIGVREIGVVLRREVAHRGLAYVIDQGRIAEQRLEEHALAQAGVGRFEHPEAELLRTVFRLEREAIHDPARTHPFEKYRKLALKAVLAQRELLETLRAENRVNIDEYNLLLEEIDWRELSVLPAEARRIEETS